MSSMRVVRRAGRPLVPAQKLPGQDYHFDAGFVTGPRGSFAYSIEVDGAGNIVYEMKASTILYRTFRMTSMYTPQ